MKPIKLTKFQKFKLIELAKFFYPEFISITLENFESTGKVIFLKQDENNIKNFETIHWFEFCLMFLCNKVAEYYEKHVVSTQSYSKFLIMQKVTNELDKNNPVDVLYQIWKNPQNYLPEL